MEDIEDIENMEDIEDILFIYGKKTKKNIIVVCPGCSMDKIRRISRIWKI